MPTNDHRLNTIKNAVFALLFACAAIFLFWKCRYGFGNWDESFYLTVPYRLWMGDGLFGQEWHLSQMAGFLLLPFMAVFMLFSGGSTTGIILTFRYFYTAVQACAALFVYLRLKKISWPGAVVASLLFFLYAPFGIMAMSYNSLGILCLTLSAVLLVTNQKERPWEYALAGLFFAAAVLCCPYLAAVYFLYSLLAVVNHWIRFSAHPLLGLRCWLWLTAGISALAAVFLIFVLGRNSIGTIIKAFPAILNDPEHASRSASYLIKSYFRSVFDRVEGAKGLYLVLAGMLAVRFTDRKGRIPRAVFFIAGAIVTFLLILPFVTTHRYINSIMLPLNFFGLFCLGLTANKLARTLFFTGWLPGMLYSFCIHMASNQYYLAISSASTVSLVFSVVIIFLTLRELMTGKVLKWFACAALAGLVILQTGGLVSLRYDSVFWETSMEAQTEVMEVGPEKGLLVTPYKKAYYESYLRDTAAFRQEDKAQSVLYLSENTWLYLAGEGIEMCPYSAWLAGVNDNTIQRLIIYYDINPHKLPEVIYAEYQYAEFAFRLAAHYGYQAQLSPTGNLIFTQE